MISSFISRFAPNAIIGSLFSPGLYPSVTVAQAIVENGGNENPPGLNVFNLKADAGYTGKVISLSTHEYYGGVRTPVYGSGNVYPSRQAAIDAGDDPASLFRVYSDATDSFTDRNNFLKENPRYTNAGVFDAQTPYDQAQALQNAGYATAPNYAASINSIIDKYNLTSLDKKKIACA